MDTPREKTEATVEDLQPQAPDASATAEEAEAVRGGRKAGAEQQEYLKVTMSDVLISSY